jgi:hypothetical protein
MRHRAVVVSILLVSMLVFAWVVAPPGTFSVMLRSPIVLVQNLFRAPAAPQIPAPAGLTPTVPPKVPPTVPILPPTDNTQMAAPTPPPTSQPLISVPEVPLPAPAPLPVGTVPQPPGGVTPPGGVGGPGPSGPPGVPNPKEVLPKLP